MNKIIACITFVILSFVSLSAQSQKQLDATFQKATLEEVIDFLEKSTDCRFSYSSTSVPVDAQIDISLSEATVWQVLDAALEFLPISYEVIGNQVILKYNEMYQTVRGTVVDQDSRQPILGATVVINETSPLLGSVTDEFGRFRIENVPLGRHNVSVSFVGYYENILPNVQVGVGKEMILNISLSESAVKMDEVIIKGAGIASDPINDMVLVSGRSFTVEETKRFPVGLGDPLRLASSFAGTMGSADVQNELIVRGNNPRGILWRLEGMEIPNPNHFSAAGTSSGAISMLSPQMMARSDFFTGAFAPQYGNALSGVFDVYFRNGNEERHERTIQAGFLGLDAALEGPLSRSKGSSYLVNYRYSTLGMLNALGLVDVGGSTNTFQDLSFRLNIPTNSMGTFTFYGLGGRSYFNAEENFDVQLYDTEDYWMGVTGLKHQVSLGKNTYLQSSMGWSVTKNIDDFTEEGETIQNTTFNKNYWRASVSANSKLSAKNVLEIGAILTRQNFDYQETDIDYDSMGNALPVRILFNDEGDTWTQQAFLAWKYRITNDLILVNGVHVFHFSMNGETSVEPRSSIKWNFTSNQSFSLGVGLHSRLESLEYYLGNNIDQNGDPIDYNRELKVTKSIHYVLGYDLAFFSNWYLKMEAYYQHLYDVPVSDIDGYRWFSTINLNKGYASLPLVNDGTGKNYGIELTLEKKFSEGYYFMLNTSIFSSKYKAADQIERNTRYNGNYVYNMLGGKEWTVGQKKNKVVGFSMKLGLAGNQRILGRSIDTIYDNNLPAYKRFDVQINFRKNKKKHTSEWRLDLQNVTNQTNYFNSDDQSFVEPSLGFVPVLSYRIEF